MTRSKKIFTAFAIAFLLALIYVVFDISRRTTFPGARHDRKADSARIDSASRVP